MYLGLEAILYGYLPLRQAWRPGEWLGASAQLLNTRRRQRSLQRCWPASAPTPAQRRVPTKGRSAERSVCAAQGTLARFSAELPACALYLHWPSPPTRIPDAPFRVRGARHIHASLHGKVQGRVAARANSNPPLPADAGSGNHRIVSCPASRQHVHTS